mgnify:CR=1 FL=1
MSKLGPISNFFLFCSGVSRDIISSCPSFEIIKYSTIGATIFLTSILAFISSFFALSLIFDNIIFIVLGSIFWSAIIFNLDRYIVISLRPTDSFINNFIIAFPRFIIALMVAIVISKPIEIKLFEKEITNFHNLDKFNQTNILYENFKSNLFEIDLKKEQIESKFKEKKDFVDKYKEDYLCEAAGTCGTMIRGRGLEYQSRKERWLVENNLLKIELRKKDSLLNLENLKEINLKDKFDNEKSLITNSSYGFFDKVSALNSVNRIASNFILLIFIMVEISPMLAKLLSKKGPYETLIMKSEIEYETDYLNSSDSLKILRSKNEKLKKIDAEIDLKIKKIGIKNIKRQDAFERYEKLRNNSKDED